MSLLPKCSWKILFFKDEYNYSGICEDSGCSIVTNWSISESLPLKLSSYFVAIISEYIHKLHTFKDEMISQTSNLLLLNFSDSFCSK